MKSNIFAIWRLRRWIALALALSSYACGARAKQTAEDRALNAPLLTRQGQIEAYDGQRVALLGRYLQKDVRMKPRPPARYIGHVAIVLDDGALIFLAPTWHSAARRTADEIARFDGRRVAVLGTLHAVAPAAPNHTASVISPCLFPIESIQLLP